jgi:dihydrofolate reductase
MDTYGLKLSMLVAATERGVIGKEGDMPWHIPSDLRRFREITTGVGTCIMGRVTYAAILRRLGKPLPDRYSIVLTRQWTRDCDSVRSAASLDEALRIAADATPSACIIGGGQVYRLFLPHVSRIHLTTVFADIEGDTFFPKLGNDWTCCTHVRMSKGDARDQYPTSYSVYGRSK